MKKAITILLILSMLFTLCACGGASPAGSAPAQETQEAAAAEETQPAEEAAEAAPEAAEPAEETAEAAEEPAEEQPHVVTVPRVFYSGTVEEVTAELEEAGFTELQYDPEARTFTGVLDQESLAALYDEAHGLMEDWLDSITKEETEYYSTVLNADVSEDGKKIALMIDADETNFYDGFALWAILKASVRCQLFSLVPYEEAQCVCQYVNKQGDVLESGDFREWLAETNAAALAEENPEPTPEPVPATVIADGDTISIEDIGSFEVKGWATAKEFIRGGMKMGSSKIRTDEDTTLMYLTINFKNEQTEDADPYSMVENLQGTYDGKYSYTGGAVSWTHPIVPLAEAEIYVCYVVPVSVAEATESFVGEFTIGGQTFSYTFR